MDNTDNKIYNGSTNGTITIPGRCLLVAIIINTKGGSSNTATLYDSNSTLGANAELKKAKIDTTAYAGRIDYGIPLYNGIYIVVATGTAADISILYRELPAVSS